MDLSVNQCSQVAILQSAYTWKLPVVCLKGLIGVEQNNIKRVNGHKLQLQF